MMKGLETGRMQVAARATGVARAAFDDATRYAQDRQSFGKPIWQHQSVGNLLANMGTKLYAARSLLLDAARRVDTGSVVTWRPGWPSCSPRRPRWRSRWTRCASTAATATPPSTTWNATSATPR